MGGHVSQRSSGASIVALMISGLLAATLLGFVIVFGSNIPIGDDFNLVPILTGSEPFRLGWLWEQHNEHRIPLPKVVYLALWHLSGGNFHYGMLFNAACLVLLTALLLLASRAAFGRLSGFDLFLPLVLLHWGQHENLLWHFQVQFLLSTLLAGLILAVLVQVQDRPTPAQGLTVGLALLALPLTGANGLGLVPALAFWLLLVGGAHVSAGRRGWGGLLILLALAALALIPLSFLNYHAAHVPPARSVGGVLRTAGQFWGMALGPIGGRGWPIVALVVGAFTLGAVVVGARVARRRREERYRALGLMLYLGAFACLAAGIGWGRAHLPVAGFANRYVTLGAPMFCATFFAFRLYGDRRLPLLMTFLLVVLLPYNLAEGLTKARGRQRLVEEFEADVRAGLPPAEMGQKYTPRLYQGGYESTITPCFEMLRRARQGPYRDFPDP